MAKFGEALRKERESRGIALETIVAATKISTRYLQAVEQDRFDQLPGGLFNRSIVRNYARTLGLNEDEWVDKYVAATQPADDLHDDDKNWTAFAENVGRARGKSMHGRDGVVRWAGVAALLLVLGGLSWFVWGYVHHKTQSSALLTETQTLAVR